MSYTADYYDILRKTKNVLYWKINDNTCNNVIVDHTCPEKNCQSLSHEKVATVSYITRFSCKCL